MRHRAGLRAAALAVAILAGCASAPPAPPDASSLSGRLSLQVAATQDRPAQSLNAAFELQGGADHGELRLSTPLGTTLALAAWLPGQARLVTPQGERRFDDLDALSREVFGEELPLRALPDWLRGHPWSGAADAAQPLPDAPGFAQLGWHIELAGFASGLVQARRAGPPAVRLRAQIDPAP
ncbi:MAG TPA: outer membrane lipoprotein LolB [Rubrivivax sp.]|nr:outer membrane lipoprotein LolB [Rubrivivax sp.]